MHCEDLLIDDSCDGQAIKAVGECLPQLDVIASLTLVVEAVYTIDRGAFMIATENEKVLGVFDLVCKKQADSLQRLLASIHVITKEEVVRFRRESSVLK